jgi:hypothetical protein
MSRQAGLVPSILTPERTVSDPTEPDPPPGHSAGGGGADDDGGDAGDGGDGGGGSTGGADGGATAVVADGAADPRWKAVPDRFWWMPFLVGVAMLAGYAVFLSFMMNRVDAKDPDWSRLVYLFSGVEALAFGAAGFFFGREVHRGRAEAAESRADAESRRASKSEKEATTANARIETFAALTDDAPGTRRRGGMESAHLEAAGAADHVDARVRLQAIARLARQWRPRT